MASAVLNDYHMFHNMFADYDDDEYQRKGQHCPLFNASKILFARTFVEPLCSPPCDQLTAVKW